MAVETLKFKERISKKRSEPLEGVRTAVPGCPIREENRFIVFGNLTNNAVWVSAHGNYTGKSFTTPAGTSVQFFCKHGYTLECPLRRLPNFRPDPSGNPGLLIAPSTRTYDYHLHKFQGRWGMMESYENVATRAVAAGITIVTVRNRWYADGIMLSDLVADLRKIMTGLTLVNGIHCRATDPELGTYPNT